MVSGGSIFLTQGGTMKHYIQTLFGVDFPMTPNIDPTGICVGGIGVESDSIDGINGNTVNSISYFLKGTTAEIRDQLLAGKAYLEFWIEAIDHTTPTANRKLYPADVFQKGLETNAVQNMFANGGIPGEGEHPKIKMYSDNMNSEQSVFNNMSRIARIESNDATHYIIAYKCTPQKTYFKIRTSLKNLAIVKDILAGRRPCFSIRCVGDFCPREDGIVVATRLQLVTIDYVANPANATSYAEPTMKYIDTIDQTPVELQLLQRTGTESEEMVLNWIGNRKLVVDKNLSAMESLFCMNVLEEAPEQKTVNFQDKMSHLCHDFL